MRKMTAFSSLLMFLWWHCCLSELDTRTLGTVVVNMLIVMGVVYSVCMLRVGGWRMMQTQQSLCRYILYLLVLTSFDVNILFVLSASQIKKVILHYDLSEDVDLALDPSLKVSYIEAASCWMNNCINIYNLPHWCSDYRSSEGSF